MKTSMEIQSRAQKIARFAQKHAELQQQYAEVERFKVQRCFLCGEVAEQFGFERNVQTGEEVAVTRCHGCGHKIVHGPAAEWR